MEAGKIAQAFSDDKVSLRTRLSYGIGTIGRDAAYTLVSSYLITYLTFGVAGFADNAWLLGAVGIIMLVARIWDAVNDPVMGSIIDNTRSRFGKFKPFIIAGALTNCVITVLMFSGVFSTANPVLFLVMFAVSLLLWDVTYTMNDIAYWGMLPSLTINPKEREKVTSLARIGASVGLFAVTALVPMLTPADINGRYRLIAIVCAALFIACQVLVLVGVQEKKNAVTTAQSGAKLRDIFKVIGKNDQLLAIAVTLLLFSIGYYITTGFGTYFFWFDYGNYGGMEFTFFALTIGVTQILVMAIFPLLRKKFSRRQLFTVALCIVVAGYLGFMATGYLWPMSLPVLMAVGFVLFGGQAIIQMLQYVLLADTVEYGQWKLGTRNESVVFSVRPFIDKLSAAIQSGVIALTLIVSGLNGAAGEISALQNDPNLAESVRLAEGNAIVANIDPASTFIMRLFMLALPLVCIAASYVVYRLKYKLTEQKYGEIIAELEAKGTSAPPEEV